MTWEDLIGEITALLEPWDVGAPQGDPEQYQLWCGSYAAVRERLPHLPQVQAEQPPSACIDLVLETSAGTVTRVDYEGYGLDATLARLGLVRQAEEYAAAVPGPVEVAGPAVLAAMRRLLTPEDVRGAGEGSYRVLGEGASAGRQTAPALVLPGGPLVDGHYLGDLGGLADTCPLAVLDLPWRRVEDLVPVVDGARKDLGLDRVDLLAHSAGAALAFTYLPTYPERVRSLVLVCPAIRTAGVADDPDGVGEVIRRRSVDEGYAAALAASEAEPSSIPAQRIYFGRWGDQHAELAVTTLWDREERLAAYYGDPRPDVDRIRAAATGFEGPVTVVHGGLDLHPTVRQARELAALFPHGRAVELPGAAHYPWLDDAEAFVEATGAALAR